MRVEGPGFRVVPGAQASGLSRPWTVAPSTLNATLLPSFEQKPRDPHKGSPLSSGPFWGSLS